MFRLIICIAVCFLSCFSKKPDQSDYSYSILTRFGNETNSVSIISYDNWLFQFQVQKNLNHTIINSDSSITTAVTYDTTGVEIIHAISKKIVMIDKFHEQFAILGYGIYPDSSKVLKTDEIMIPDSVSREMKMKDTIINNESYFISSFSIKTILGEDSLSGYTYWKRVQNFKSVFSLNASKESQLIPLGVFLFLHKEKYTIELRINGIRPLSSTEKKTCKRILGKLDIKLSAYK